MDKQQLLKDYKRQEDRICLSQILDKRELSKLREKIEKSTADPQYVQTKRGMGYYVSN